MCFISLRVLSCTRANVCERVLSPAKWKSKALWRFFVLFCSFFVLCSWCSLFAWPIITSHRHSSIETWKYAMQEISYASNNDAAVTFLSLFFHFFFIYHVMRMTIRVAPKICVYIFIYIFSSFFLYVSSDEKKVSVHELTLLSLLLQLLIRPFRWIYIAFRYFFLWLCLCYCPMQNVCSV